MAIRLSEPRTANPINSTDFEVEKCGGWVSCRSAKRRMLAGQNDDQKRRRAAS